MVSRHETGGSGDGVSPASFGQLDRRNFLHVGAASVLSLSAGGLLAACGSAKSGAGSPTVVALKKAPTALFDPTVAPGLKPNLPHRFAFPSPADVEAFNTIGDALRKAAEARGLEYLSAQANGDSTKQYQQIEGLLSRGVGAMLILDLAPPTLAPLQLQAIKQGTAVICGPFADSTCQMTTDQYKLGHDAGVSAVRWIKEHLGGNAEVSLFNGDQQPAQRPKSQGVRDALKEGGGEGIKLVSDVTVKLGTPDEAYQVTNTILQRHPNVNVWLGVDGSLGGTLAALEAAGEAGADRALFSYGDGDAQTIKSILKGGPFKSTRAFPYPVVACGWAKYAADWLEGKSIPLVISLQSVDLNSKATIDAFNAGNASPEEALVENEQTFKWFKPLGNTSYEQHRYLTVVV
jgi:ribose transport system substrate-binding protein